MGTVVAMAARPGTLSPRDVRPSVVAISLAAGESDPPGACPSVAEEVLAGREFDAADAGRMGVGSCKVGCGLASGDAHCLGDGESTVAGEFKVAVTVHRPR
jgi:hypothetical protein